MTDKEWLNNLKVGDPVFIDDSCSMGGKAIIAQVKRLTKTQIVVGATKYRKDDGGQIGGSSYFRTRLEFPTPVRIAEVRRQVLIRRLGNVRWEKHSLELLEQIWKEIETGRD